jgi:uncharacterized protein
LGILEWLFVGIVLFLSALVIGLGGFGFNIMVIAFLPLLLSVKFVIPFSINFSLGLNGYLLLRCYRHLERRHVIPIFLGIFLGVPLGVFLLKSLDEWTMKKALGLIIFLYSILSLTSFFEARRHLGTRWAYLTGFLAGGFGGAFGIGGPPTVVYVTAQAMEKFTARAVLLASSVFVYALALPLYSFSGLVSGEMIFMNLVFSPTVILGVWVGHWLFTKVDHGLYRRIILFLLMGQGCMLLVL